MADGDPHYFNCFFLLSLAILCPLPLQDGGRWYAYDDHCYQFKSLPHTLTWHAAESHCADLTPGGHLVSITNQNEANFIHQMLTSTWSDLTDAGANIYIGEKGQNKTKLKTSTHLKYISVVRTKDTIWFVKM